MAKGSPSIAEVRAPKFLNLDSKNNILVSVIIPVKNGDAWLGDTIPAILRQQIQGGLEIIVIDSGSTDNTLSLLKKYPVRVHPISPEEFNHGTTRNLGVTLASGKYVVMTVQDALPADENWLQHLLDGFDDGTVAAVCGQQVVASDVDKNPVYWFRPLSPPGKKKIAFNSPIDFDALPPAEKKAACSWDNVNAMYRKDILQQLPFHKVEFAEDALWAKDALRAGYSLAYNTAARVYHYHFETPDFTFRRNFTEHYYYYKFFGTLPAAPGSELLHLLKNARLLLKETKLGWKDKWKWLLFNSRQRKAFRHSVTLFTETLQKGEASLDQLHTQLCGRSPQAIKPGEFQKIS